MIGKVMLVVKEGIMFYFTFIIVSTFASEMTINQTESQTNMDHYYCCGLLRIYCKELLHSEDCYDNEM